MSDYDSVLRRKEKIRYPELSDQENNELNKVYFGNPFKWNIREQNSQANEMTYDERTWEGGAKSPDTSPTASKKFTIPADISSFSHSQPTNLSKDTATIKKDQ